MSGACLGGLSAYADDDRGRADGASEALGLVHEHDIEVDTGAGALSGRVT